MNKWTSLPKYIDYLSTREILIEKIQGSSCSSQTNNKIKTLQTYKQIIISPIPIPCIALDNSREVNTSLCIRSNGLEEHEELIKNAEQYS